MGGDILLPEVFAKPGKLFNVDRVAITVVDSFPRRAPSSKGKHGECRHCIRWHGDCQGPVVVGLKIPQTTHDSFHRCGVSTGEEDRYVAGNASVCVCLGGGGGGMKRVGC